MHNNNDIDIIINNLIYLKPVTIILYGSYGRDEGGWYIDHHGSIKPYNDYDILIILNQLISNDEILMIKNKLESQVRVRWVDVSQKTIKQLKKLKPSIFNYDLKYGSTVIHGAQNILDHIPEMDSSDIPLEDANILFKTRMWTFLGSLNELGFNNNIYGEQARFFRNQMAKAVLSIIDVCLLQKGAYHHSYKQRVLSFTKLFPQKKELCSLAEWALKEKLEPCSKHMNENEIKLLYQEIHKNFLIEMFVVLSKRYHFNIDNPEQLIFLWKFYPINFLKRVVIFIINQSKKFENQILLDSAQLYILMSFNNEHKKIQYLKKANKILNRLNKNVNHDLTWDEARLLVAEMRLS